ncbi:MAG: CoA-binding protein [Candidatus Eremiobacteraeota bacterium]|nr:CoA-binding protein [Candidatus Eremiobacteraeota bacterium]
MILKTPSQLHALLERSKTIAMMGASDKPLRPSYTVFSYLRTQGRFAVAPINPTVPSIDGVPAFADLKTYAAAHGAPDIVDVFRKPSEVLAVAQEAIDVGARCIWFQYGVINEEAIALADRAGLDVVVDRCLKVESARWNGGLASIGLNSGRLSSRWTKSQ